MDGIDNAVTMKRFIPAILFYAVSLPLLVLLEKWEPSGPCTPGLGILASIFIFIPVSIGIVCYNLYKARKDKAKALGAAFHVAVLFILT